MADTFIATNTNGFTSSKAIFNTSKRYRYVLTREWTEGKGAVAFIGLNPSTATHEVSDPTVTRCVNYAKRWGFKEMIMLNIFALRSTDPKELYKAREPIGRENNDYIESYTEEAKLVIAGWGNHGDHRTRGREVSKIIKDLNVKCFGINKSGHPVHPLYQRNDARLIDFNMEGLLE